MYAMLGVFAIMFVAAVVEVFLEVPTIQAVRGWLDRVFIGKGYLRFFGMTAVFAAAGYALGLVTMGPFLGLYHAGTEVGTLYIMTLLLGWVFCFFGFVGDVRARAGQVFGGSGPKASSTSLLFSTAFVTALWGCAILLTFYDHSVSGPLVGISVNLPTGH